MFCRMLIFLAIIFFSCRNNNNSIEHTINLFDTTSINTFLQKNQIEKALLIADINLKKLKQNNDINQYIYSNQWLINILNQQFNIGILKSKYYKNIFSTYSNAIKDSFALSSITNAFYWWSEFYYQNGGRFDDSIIVCLEKSIALNKQNHSLKKREERYAYKILGILYNEIGDLKKATSYYDFQKKLVDTTDFNTIAGITINNCIALKEIGNIDKAIEMIINIKDANSIIPIRYADLYIILSGLQIQKKLMNEANFSLYKAINILDTFTNVTKDVEEKKAQAYSKKGILQLLNNEIKESIQSQLQAINHYKATGNIDGRGIAKIYLELGKSYEASMQYDSALKYYQVALKKVVPVDSSNYLSNPLPTKLYAENTIMEALDAKANVLLIKYKQTANTGYLANIIDCYKISFTVEQKLMQNFSYDESRILMLTQSKKRSEQAINVCHQLFNISKNNNWTNEAFLFAEKSKAFVLLESIKRNLAGNTVLQNDSIYQHIQYLNARLTYLDKTIILTQGDNSDSLKAIYNNQKNAINNELLLANNELKRNNSAYQIMSNKEDSLSIELVQKAILDNETAFIEFFEGDSSTYVFSFTKNTPCTFFKTTDTIRKTVNKFLAFFSDKNNINNNPTEYQSAAFNLYSQLNFPSLNITTTKCILIPDGSFNLVPFEALVSTLKTEINPKYFNYFLLHKQINYNYSAATILKQLEYIENSNNNSIACFAPVFANNERGNTPLPNTAEELNTINDEVSNGKYYYKQLATTANFKKQLNKANILHIATHANANLDSNLQQPQIEFIDSTLFLNELYAMHTNAHLVVLSACETGKGVINKSEGAMSLARGFYYAGAKNVITSLWNVNDKSTAAIFRQFYKIKNDNDYSQSLHLSKLNYLKEATATTSSPYYWAGFIHIGVPVQASHNSSWIYYLLLFVTFLALIIFIKKYFAPKG